MVTVSSSNDSVSHNSVFKSLTYVDKEENFYDWHGLLGGYIIKDSKILIE